MSKLFFKSLFGLLLISLVMVAGGCKKENPTACTDPTNPQCENYDPCYGKQEVTADFEIGYFIHTYPAKLYVPNWITDVAFIPSQLSFRVINYNLKDTNVKYTWILGSEIIHEHTFLRDFRGVAQNNIPVTLIVEKKPNLSCHPFDNGKDTITKYIRLVDRGCDFLSIGDFKVLFEGENDSTVIYIRNWYTGGPIRLYGIKDSCRIGQLFCIGFNRDKPQPDTFMSSFDAFQFYSSIYIVPGQSNGVPRGTPLIKVDPNTLKVEGEYHIVPNPEKIFKFKGRKLL